MIDINLLRENPEIFRASQRARGKDEAHVDRILEADAARRASIGTYENLRAEQNAFGKQVAKAPKEEKPALVAQAKELAARVAEAKAESEAKTAEYEELLSSIENLIIDGVPTGGEDDFVVLKEVGTPRDFAAEGFEPRDHLEIGELIGGIDMARGAKVSGSRFYYLKGAGARLELALLTMAEPASNQTADIQAAKYRSLANLHHYADAQECQACVVRGQYSAQGDLKGYLEEEGVDPASRTETYFAAKVMLDLPEWEGVPFYLRTGKRLNQKATMVDVLYRPTQEGLEGVHLRIEIAPDLGYTLWLNTKAIGYSQDSHRVPLSFRYNSEELAESPDDYARLIFEASQGDREHFTQWCEVAAAWKFLDNIQAYWTADTETPLAQYPAGSHGPQEADDLLARDGFEWLLK